MIIKRFIRAIYAPTPNLGDNSIHQGNFVQAREYYEQSLAIARELNDSIILKKAVTPSFDMIEH
jgi:Tfp pilus assembly protein PilF